MHRPSARFLPLKASSVISCLVLSTTLVASTLKNESAAACAALSPYDLDDIAKSQGIPYLESMLKDFAPIHGDWLWCTRQYEHDSEIQFFPTTPVYELADCAALPFLARLSCGERCAPGGVVVDVGAGDGHCAFRLLAAEETFDEVHLYEPDFADEDSSLLKFVERTVAVNGWQSRARFHGRAGSSRSSIESSDPQANVSLDVSLAHAPKIRLIKLDIDEADTDSSRILSSILDGAGEVLKRTEALQLEVDSPELARVSLLRLCGEFEPFGLQPRMTRGQLKALLAAGDKVTRAAFFVSGEEDEGEEQCHREHRKRVEAACPIHECPVGDDRTPAVARDFELIPLTCSAGPSAVSVWLRCHVQLVFLRKGSAAHAKAQSMTSGNDDGWRAAVRDNSDL
eukprot:TRINITY_DN65958_c0_g1_i1.p1 TRINITY_DN65958_c0_g1~~TRINITY_DN65958_c0_g1_i1.p1  ORF type:complete len:398 (+),score=62.04 TRINITY_DN65958_c0_g1_i1:60-1253(+)